jgi:hypothetical protein
MKWAARRMVKGALTLIWAVVWLVLLFGVHAEKSFPGTPKGQALLLALVTGLPFVLAYVPLSRLVTKRLEQAAAIKSSGR